MQKRFCRVIFGLGFTIAVAAAGGEREDRVSERLRAEGFSRELSDVDGLVRLIYRSQTQEGHDPTLPYRNLERFTPFSEHAGVKVLDLVINAVLQQSQDVDTQRLLNCFYYSPFRFPSFRMRLLTIMYNSAPSDTRRLAADILSGYEDERADAIEVLRSLLLNVQPYSGLQISTAFSLLRANGYVEQAEAVLKENLRPEAGVEKVLAFAAVHPFATRISDNLLKAMQESARHLPDGSLGRQLLLRIQLARQPGPCRVVLLRSSKVIPFPRRR